MQAAVEAERASFAALPWDEAVQDVLSGLTSQGMTEKQLATTAEEPEDWQPQVGLSPGVIWFANIAPIIPPLHMPVQLNWIPNLAGRHPFVDAFSKQTTDT